MGFYPPASLVRDAQRRGVEVLPARRERERRAGARSRTRPSGSGSQMITSIGEDEALALVAERDANGPFRSIRGLAQRAPLKRAGLEALVASGACDALGESRRGLFWELGLVPRGESVPGTGGEARQLALPLEPTAATPALREQTPWERDARRLPDDEHVGRRPSARSSCDRTSRAKCS